MRDMLRSLEETGLAIGVIACELMPTAIWTPDEEE